MSENINRSDLINGENGAIDKTLAYMQNIEKIFGKYLKGEDKDGYDGKLEGDKTGLDKYASSEKFEDLKNKLSNEKISLTKQQLVNTLLKEMLREKGVEYGKINDKIESSDKSKLIGELNKEQIEYTKELSEVADGLGKAYEVKEENYSSAEKKTREKIEKISKELGIDISSWERKDLYSADKFEELKNKLVNSLLEENKILLKKLIDAKGSVRVNTENKIEKNTILAREYQAEKDLSEVVGKWIQYGLESGTLPLAIMATPGLRKVMPLLPAIIGIGIRNRIYNLKNSNEKFKDGSMLVGETIFAIAPITGTIYAGNETHNAWLRYKNGTGDFGSVVANGIGTVVSAGFDGVTVFLVATGIGTPAAVGLTTVRTAAKESIVFGTKKLIGKITGKTVELGRKSTAGFKKISKDFIKQNINTVKGAIENKGTASFMKEFIKKSAIETKDGLKTIMTLGVNKNTFSYLKNLKNISNAENLSSKDIEAIASAKNDYDKLDNDDVKHLKLENEIKALEIQKSSESLDQLLLNIKDSDNNELLSEMLNSLKNKDFYISNSVISVGKIMGELSSTKNNNEKIDSIENILQAYNSRISGNLKKFINDSIIGPLKQGKKIDTNSPEYILLANKQHGKNIYTTWGKDSDAINGYKELLENTKTTAESSVGYSTSMFKIEKEIRNAIANSTGEKRKILMSGYLDIIQQSDKLGLGQAKVKNEIIKKIKYNENIIKNHNLTEKEIQNYKKHNKISEKQLENINNHSFKSEYEYKISNLMQGFSKNGDMKAMQDLVSIIKLNDIKDNYILNNIVGFISYDKKHFKENMKHLTSCLENKELISKVQSNKEIIKYIDENLDNIDSVKELFNIKKVFEKVNKDNSKDGNNESPIGVDLNNKIEEKILSKIGTEKEKILSKAKDKSDISKQRKAEYQFDKLMSDFKLLSESNKKQAYETILGNKNTLEFAKKDIISHNVLIDFVKTFPENQLKEKMANFILNGNYKSLEFSYMYLKNSIGFSEKGNLKDNNYFNKKITKAYIEKLKNNIDNINEIEAIEYMVKYHLSKDLKIPGIEKDIDFINQKIEEIKNTEIYKQREETIDILSTNLLDLARSYSIDDLLMYKQSGKLNHRTLETLKEASNNAKSETKKAKIDGLISDIEKVMKHYETNNFNIEKYNSNLSTSDKVKYLIENVINIPNGLPNSEKNELAIKQLNLLKNKFDIDYNVIKNVVYKYLEGDIQQLSNINVKERINFLNRIEEYGVIKPSNEIKLEFMIRLESDVKDIREHTAYISQYTNNFQGGFLNDFLVFKGKTPDEIKQIVSGTKDQREPVGLEYMQKNALVDKNGNPIKGENKDWVKLGENEYYIINIKPGRYFLNKMLEEPNLKMKETYMEIIRNTSDFGDTKIVDIFREVEDINTKILLCSHKDLKDLDESINILKKFAKNPDTTPLVFYSIMKGYTNELEQAKILSDAKSGLRFTKEYFENKEGKDISDKDFQDRLKIFNDILNIKEEIDGNNLATLSRLSDEIDINVLKSLPQKVINDFLFIKNLNDSELLKNISKITEDINKNAIYIEAVINNQADEFGQLIKKAMNDGEILLKYIKIFGAAIFSAMIFKAENLFAVESIETKKLQNQQLAFDNKLESLPDNIKTDKIKFDEYIDKEIQNYPLLNKEYKKDPEKVRNALFEQVNTPIAIDNEFSKQVNKLPIGLIAGALLFKSDLMADINGDWEKSNEKQEYDKLIEQNKFEEAMNIKKEKIEALTKLHLDKFIDDFKDQKSEDKYLDKMNTLPIGLRDLTADIHKAGAPLLKNQSEKGKHDFVKAVYKFMEHYYKETGKAEIFADKIIKKAPGVEGSQFMEILINMGKQSDIESKKTPEQKQAELKEYIRQKQENIDASQEKIDASQEKIDAENRKQEERRKITNMLKQI